MRAGSDGGPPVAPSLLFGICLAVASVLTLLAWQRDRLAPNWRLHAGLLLAGWGGFNLVEAVVDHQIPGVHHVRDDLGAPLTWDLGFLAFGALLVGVGWLLHDSGRHALRVPDSTADR